MEEDNMRKHQNNPVHIKESMISRGERKIDTLIFTGSGAEFIKTVSNKIDLDGSVILDYIINNLLVKKGVDWNNPILGEYLGIYKNSMASFSLVWDKKLKGFISHGTTFQSKENPYVGLIAHIRTLDEYQGMGLGTLMTEETTKIAFENNAELAVLATDDKLHRIESGERAAYTLYSKLGYAILAEKKLADTVDWLMITDREIFSDCLLEKEKNNGRYPKEVPAYIKEKQLKLIDKVRGEFSIKKKSLMIDEVTDGDIAFLFMLTALSPEYDFKIKLDSWDVHLGAEFERSFVVNIRPAMLDQDRLEDATLVLRDEKGFILAVCAAKQVYPFSRNTMKIDFYCFPEFMDNNKKEVLNLINATIKRIKESEDSPNPCILSFSGIDEVKISIFKDLGFKETGNRYQYYNQDGTLAYETIEYSNKL
jgi:ribosomal protein S18 acetylase RimI-like enzyme